MDMTYELDQKRIPSSFRSVSLPVTLRTSDQVLELSDVVIGLDFVMGAMSKSVYFVPLNSVIEVSEIDNSLQRQVFLSDVLSAQKQPLLIHYRIGDHISSAWLLNIAMPWLRLAHPQGLIWVPFSRVEFAQISSPELIAKATAN